MENDYINLKVVDYRKIQRKYSKNNRKHKKDLVKLSLVLLINILEKNLLNPNHSIYSSTFLPQTVLGEENFIKESIDEIIDIPDKLSKLSTYLFKTNVHNKDDIKNNMSFTKLDKYQSNKAKINEEKNYSNNKILKKHIPLKKIEIKQSKLSPNNKNKNESFKKDLKNHSPRPISPILRSDCSKKCLHSPQQIIHIPSYIRNGVDFKKELILKQYSSQVSLKTAETSKNIVEFSISNNSDHTNELNKLKDDSKKYEYHHFHELSFGIKSEQTNSCSNKNNSDNNEIDTNNYSFYRSSSPINPEILKQEVINNDLNEEYIFIGSNKKNRDKLESLYNKVNK